MSLDYTRRPSLTLHFLHHPIRKFRTRFEELFVLKTAAHFIELCAVSHNFLFSVFT